MNKNSARDIPIACSLSAGDLVKRQEAWRTLLDNSLVARERVQGGLRLVVRADAGPQLNHLVEEERICCPWITFAVTRESVTLTAQEDGEDILVQMFSFGQPSSLCGPDVFGESRPATISRRERN